MAVLYIIGAGCSTNYSQCISKVPHLRPPLNANFFAIAKKVIDYYNLCHMFGPIIGLDHFTSNMNRLYGYGDSESDTSVFDDERLTLEGVMNYFYTEAKLLEYDSLIGQNSRIQTLNELLAYVLAETMIGKNCRMHLGLAKLLNPGDIVWSLNYDVLLDNALFALGKITDSGYAMRFDYTITSQTPHPTSESRSDVLMFKFHGSLNWLQCATCDRNLLLQDEKFPIKMWERIRSLDLKCPQCKATRFLGLKRLIVPPAATKEFENVGIRYLWKAAYDRCISVERIVSIGFSFSQLDYELEMILRSLVERNRLPRRIPITIVNPDPKVSTSRFRSIFEKSPITSIPSLGVFLKRS